MKVYIIPNASKLKEAIELMKNPVEAKKAKSVATVWSVTERRGLTKSFKVYVEVGRKAQLLRRADNELIVLGDMHLPRTREFVKGLIETNESS